MGGVDGIDDSIGNYQIAIRGRKWCLPLTCYLIIVCVNNALLIPCEGEYKNNMLELIRDIVHHWLKNCGVARINASGQALHSIEAVGYDKINHFIVKRDESKRQKCKQRNSQVIYFHLQEI